MIRRSTDVTRRAGDASCLAPGTTAAEINALFASKGASAGVLDLCPGTIYLLEETIFFTAPGQGLRTLGGAAVARSQRAELRIASAGISTALNSMNCVDCDSLLVEDLLFNGSRGTYGPLKGGEALIELGGASKGHSVLRSKIFDTRGWSSLHFMCALRLAHRSRAICDADYLRSPARSEGYRLDCSDATVTDNEIGPSGQSYNEGPIADGISLSCRNSLVTRNTIFDATGACLLRATAQGLLADSSCLSLEQMACVSRPWAAPATPRLPKLTAHSSFRPGHRHLWFTRQPHHRQHNHDVERAHARRCQHGRLCAF